MAEVRFKAGFKAENGLWHYLKDSHAVASLDELLEKPQEELETIVNTLGRIHLRDLNNELIKCDEPAPKCEGENNNINDMMRLLVGKEKSKHDMGKLLTKQWMTNLINERLEDMSKNEAHFKLEENKLDNPPQNETR